MRSYAFILSLVLCLALAQAGPVTKEKQTLVEETKIEKTDNIKLEDQGAEKDRLKKSTTTFCVQINPGSPQSNPVPCDCKEPNAIHLHSDHPIVQPPAHTINVHPPHQQAHTDAYPPHSAAIVQPSHESVHPPAHTLNIVRPVQPSHEPPHTLNIVHPVQPVQPAPSAPTHVLNIVQPVVPQSLPEPTETLNFLPISSGYSENQMVVVPSNPVVLIPDQEPSNFIQVPSCPTHGHFGHQGLGYTECTCRQHSGNSIFRTGDPAVDVIRMGMPLRERPVLTDHALYRTHNKHEKSTVVPIVVPVYSAPARSQKSPLMVQCNPKVVPLNENGSPIVLSPHSGQFDEATGRSDAVVGTEQDSLHGRSGTIISLHTGTQPQQFYQKTFQAPYPGMYSSYPVQNHLSGPAMPPGVYINAYPQIGYGSGLLPIYRQAQPEINQTQSHPIVGINVGAQQQPIYRFSDVVAKDNILRKSELEIKEATEARDLSQSILGGQKHPREAGQSSLTEQKKEINILEKDNEDAQPIKANSARSTRSDKEAFSKTKKAISQKKDTLKSVKE